MRTIFLAFVLILHGAPPAIAQSQIPPRAPGFREAAEPAKPTATSDHHKSSIGSFFSDLGHEITRLPSKGTALTLGIGGALALAAYPADRVLTERASMSEPLDDVFEIGAVTGSGWVQVGGALGTYVLGRTARNEQVQAVGADLVQAQILNSMLTEGIKRAVHRMRPDHGRFSFPSGHASGTFATATALHRHFGWKIGLPAYGLATYVAASRLQENRHYASDVIFGAAIGIVAGRTVTVGRGTGRFAIAPVVVPGGAGVTFCALGDVSR